MPSPLSHIATDIQTLASRHQRMLQAAASDHDLASALDEIARDHIDIVERIVAYKKARERTPSSAPADVDEFTLLMIAAENAKPTADEKSFLLSMEDIHTRCVALQDKLGDPAVAADFRCGVRNPIAGAFLAVVRLGGIEWDSPVTRVYNFVLDEACALAEAAKAAVEVKVPVEENTDAADTQVAA
jgi:hypothetical protein